MNPEQSSFGPEPHWKKGKTSKRPIDIKIYTISLNLWNRLNLLNYKLSVRILMQSDDLDPTSNKIYVIFFGHKNKFQALLAEQNSYYLLLP